MKLFDWAYILENEFKFQVNKDYIILGNMNYILIQIADYFFNHIYALVEIIVFPEAKSKEKWQVGGEKILVMPIKDKRLIFSIHKELLKKINNPIEKWAKDIN